jgi:hypothetical protein
VIVWSINESHDNPGAVGGNKLSPTQVDLTCANRETAHGGETQDTRKHRQPPRISRNFIIGAFGLGNLIGFSIGMVGCALGSFLAFMGLLRWLK